MDKFNGITSIQESFFPLYGHKVRQGASSTVIKRLSVLYLGPQFTKTIELATWEPATNE